MGCRTPYPLPPNKALPVDGVSDPLPLASKQSSTSGWGVGPLTPYSQIKLCQWMGCRTTYLKAKLYQWIGCRTPYLKAKLYQWMGCRTPYLKAKLYQWMGCRTPYPLPPNKALPVDGVSNPLPQSKALPVDGVSNPLPLASKQSSTSGWGVEPLTPCLQTKLYQWMGCRTPYPLPPNKALPVDGVSNPLPQTKLYQWMGCRTPYPSLADSLCTVLTITP
ncbi:hypothetical protein ACOMHN_037684 [Nucella lapillus]